MTKIPFQRRNLLKLIGGAGITTTATSSIATANKPSELEFSWKFDSGGERLSAYSGTDNSVLASGLGTVYRINLDTGNEEWAFNPDTESYVGVVSTISNLNTAYISVRETRTLHAIDIETGDERWSADFNSGPSYPQPFTSDNLVFVTTENNVIAINGADGNKVWTIEYPNAQYIQLRRPFSTVGTTEPIVLIAGTDVRGVSATTGDEKWAIDPGDNVSVTFPRNGISGVRTNSSTIQALDVMTGDILWTFDTGFGNRPGYISSGRGGGEPVLHVTDGDTTMCVDLATGTERWTFTHAKGSFVMPREINNVTYVLAPEIVYAIDTTTGDVLWQFDTPTDTARETDVSLIESQLYISDGGIIYRVDSEAGDTIWEFDTETDDGQIDDTGGGLIEAEGTLYRPEFASSDSSTPVTAPRQRLLRITGRSSTEELTQDDVSNVITLFNRNESANGITVTQDDVSNVITLFERN